jgi:hypothetical protein
MESENQAPATSSGPENQTSPVVTTTVHEEKHKKKMDVKKPLIVLVVLAVAAIGVYLVMKMSSTPETVQQDYTITQDTTQILLPSSLPSSYSLEGEVGKVEGEDGKITYTANYTNGTGRISYTQSNSPTAGCIEPQQGVATSLADYKLFTPDGAVEGCTFSLAKGTQNESVIYRWANGTTQFVILIHNTNLTEDDVTTFIDSLQKTSI